jgi:hypothetical protein
MMLALRTHIQQTLPPPPPTNRISLAEAVRGMLDKQKPSHTLLEAVRFHLAKNS